MAIISLIAAMDEELGLGRHNQLLCHLPADLRHFKQQTMGKPIIMGRKTYESIGRPLPGRLNVVLSRRQPLITGAAVVGSLSEAFECTQSAEEVMVIGGATLFEQVLPLASRLYLTVIHHRFEADVFFPAWNKTDWVCVDAFDRPKDDLNPYDLTFYRYDRIDHEQ